MKWSFSVRLAIQNKILVFFRKPIFRLRNTSTERYSIHSEKYDFYYHSFSYIQNEAQGIELAKKDNKNPIKHRRN